MNAIAEILGVVGSFLAAAIALPQAVRAWTKGVEGVSAITFQILLATAIAWSIYGGVRGLWLLCIGNVILTISCAAVLIAFIRSGARLWSLVVVLAPGTAIVLLVMVVNPAWTGIVAALYSIGLRFPQLRMLRHASSIIGVSVGTWLIACSASVAWFFYALIKSDLILGVSTGINTVTSTSMIISVLVMRHRYPRGTAEPDPVDAVHLEPLPE